MDELVQWLGEQLDEDERIAQAVRVPHDWHQGPGDDPEWTDAEMVCMWPPEFHTPYERDKHWRGLTVEGPELAAHIAAHDPARVLREIEAKRKLLDDYTVTARIRDEAAARIKAAGDHPDGKDLETWDQAQREAAILEGPVKLAASPYSDRPGHRQEWRP